MAEGARPPVWGAIVGFVGEVGVGAEDVVGDVEGWGFGGGSGGRGKHVRYGRVKGIECALVLDRLKSGVCTKKWSRRGGYEDIQEARGMVIVLEDVIRR